MAQAGAEQRSFPNAYACFSDAEWRLLQEWQKELYRNVMKEIHQALISLGPIITSTVLSLRGKEVADLCSLYSQEPEEIKHGDLIHDPDKLFAINNTKSSDPTHDGVLEAQEKNECIKKDEEPVSIFIEQLSEEFQEKTADPAPGDEIISFCIKDEDLPYCLEHSSGKKRGPKKKSGGGRVRKGAAFITRENNAFKAQNNPGTERLHYPEGSEVNTSSTSIGIKVAGESYAMDTTNHLRTEIPNYPAESDILGKQFSDFQTLHEFVSAIGKKQRAIYLKKDCRTVESVNKRVAPGQKHYHEKFKYAYIRYACKHYGDYKSKSTGLRPNQRTFKVGCNANIYASVDRAKDVFIIKNATLSHKHRCY